MKKCVIRPFNVVSSLFVLIVILFIIPVPVQIFEMVKNKDFLSILTVLRILLYVVIFGWVSAVLLRIVFLPKISLYDTYLEIDFWKNGIPYDKNHPFRLPQIQRRKIYYKQLQMFGGFLLQDIKDYINKSSGFLLDQWMIATATLIPLPIRFPKKISQKRDLILFVSVDGQSTVVDGGLYGLKQVEFLIYQLEKYCGKKSSGRVSPHKRINNFVWNLVKSWGVLFWLTVIPFSAIWLEGIFNPAHIPSHQSLCKVVYIMSLFFANFSFAGYFAVLRQKQYKDILKMKKFLKILTIILYTLFIISFVLSIYVF